MQQVALGALLQLVVNSVQDCHLRPCTIVACALEERKCHFYQVPGPAAAACSTVCPPVLLYVTLGPILRRIFPDTARTYRFWCALACNFHDTKSVALCCLKAPALPNASITCNLFIGCNISRLAVDSQQAHVFRRQFLPTYVRYRWTKWRYQVAKGYPWEVSKKL